MVDVDFRVWLIEVNSSPSMDMGTPTTAVLVRQVLQDLCKVIIDYPKARIKRECDTGGFVQIYKNSVEVPRPKGINLHNLFLEGKRIETKRRRPKPKKQPTQPRVNSNFNSNK
mmetsp:Transcript_3502/g.5976  ORF Transcript_3502/g.5976 Transcript_3502/m.5976 type:complete len:113 (+) Transcript_3502:3016-3354(+)